jgi:hypothetical protein
VLVIGVSAALVPLAYLPLSSRTIKSDPESQPGFTKKGEATAGDTIAEPPVPLQTAQWCILCAGMWKELNSAAKR